MPVHLLPNALVVPSGTLDILRTKVGKAGRRIFNPDHKRKQVAIDRRLLIVRRAEAALKVAGLMTGRRITSPVVIHSDPGCQRQDWHCDYDPDLVTASTCSPMGVVVAIEPGTKFETPENAYSLTEGDILAFTGETVHAGAAYEKSNTRIHFYLDTADLPRPFNMTWFVDPVGPQPPRPTAS